MNAIKFISGVHPTFKQQFDKLTEAYIKGEVNPMDRCACFVGNLLGTSQWEREVRTDSCLYTLSEVGKLESDFMYYKNITRKQDKNPKRKRKPWLYNFGYWSNKPDSEDEQILFDAFSHTLTRLKKLHESKGEIIDDVPQFKKRVLTLQP